MYKQRNLGCTREWSSDLQELTHGCKNTYFQEALKRSGKQRPISKSCAVGISEVHAADFSTSSVFRPPGRSPIATPIVGGCHWPTTV